MFEIIGGIVGAATGLLDAGSEVITAEKEASTARKQIKSTEEQNALDRELQKELQSKQLALEGKKLNFEKLNASNMWANEAEKIRIQEQIALDQKAIDTKKLELENKGIEVQKFNASEARKLQKQISQAEQKMQREIEAGRITQQEADRELEGQKLQLQKDLGFAELDLQAAENEKNRFLQDMVSKREEQLQRDLEEGRITQQEADRKLQENRLSFEKDLGFKTLESQEKLEREKIGLQRETLKSQEAQSAEQRVLQERLQSKEMELTREVEAGRMTQQEKDRQLNESRLQFEKDLGFKTLESQETQSAEQRALQERLQSKEMELTREVEKGRMTQQEKDRQLNASRLQFEKDLGFTTLEKQTGLEEKKIASQESQSAEDRALQERLQKSQQQHETGLYATRQQEAKGIRDYGKDLASQAERQAEQITTGELPEMAALRKAVERGYDRGSQKMSSQVSSDLQRSGVRGGQAARIKAGTMANYRTGIDENLTRTAYEDAIRKRDAKLQMQQQKQAAGFSSIGART